MTNQALADVGLRAMRRAEARERRELKPKRQATWFDIVQMYMAMGVVVGTVVAFMMK